eukprot:s1516_g10.t1
MGITKGLSDATLLYKPKIAKTPLLQLELLPALTVLTIGGLLSTCGPVRPPTLRSLQDLNEQFVQLGPILNEHLYQDVSESFGDCKALWEYRVGQGEVSAQSVWQKDTCSGTTPLFQKEVTMGTAPQRHRIKTMVLWAKGVNTLEVERVRVQPPLNPLVATQEWNLNASAAFADLHVFMKVFVDDKEHQIEWYSGYICCNHRFHFALQDSQLQPVHLDPRRTRLSESRKAPEVTARCQQHKGFEALDMNLMQMDQVTLAHDAAVIHGPAWAAVTSDVGRQEMVTWQPGPGNALDPLGYVEVVDFEVLGCQALLLSDNWEGSFMWHETALDFEDPTCCQFWLKLDLRSFSPGPMPTIALTDLEGLAARAGRWLQVPFPGQLPKEIRLRDPGARAAFTLATFQNADFVEACACCGLWTASWCEGCYLRESRAASGPIEYSPLCTDCDQSKRGV